jgi:SAM-dependent methyltransferase
MYRRMSYESSFRLRAEQYKYAVDTYPHVLQEEFHIAASLCKVKEGDVIVNVLGAGVPLDKYFRVQPASYRVFDSSPEFCALYDISQCEISNLPLDNASVDTVVCVSGLHHYSNQERVAFYREARRVLKPTTGKIVIGDIVKGSRQAVWLNEFVNKFSTSGHVGDFFGHKDKYILESVGFDATEELEKYNWPFMSEFSMVDFMKNLFGLDKANKNEILDGIGRIFEPQPLGAGWVIPWTMMYYVGTVGEPKPLRMPSGFVKANRGRSVPLNPQVFRVITMRNSSRPSLETQTPQES